MYVVINEWLQEAVIDFLRDWVRDRVHEQHTETEEHHVMTTLEDATPSSVRVSWTCMILHEQPSSWPTGSEWFTPREAMNLFLQHGPNRENCEASDGYCEAWNG